MLSEQEQEKLIPRTMLEEFSFLTEQYKLTPQEMVMYSFNLIMESNSAAMKKLEAMSDSDWIRNRIQDEMSFDWFNDMIADKIDNNDYVTDDDMQAAIESHIDDIDIDSHIENWFDNNVDLQDDVDNYFMNNPIEIGDFQGEINDLIDQRLIQLQQVERENSIEKINIASQRFKEKFPKLFANSIKV